MIHIWLPSGNLTYENGKIVVDLPIKDGDFP